MYRQSRTVARLVLRAVMAAALAYAGIQLIGADRAERFGRSGPEPAPVAVPGSSDIVGGELVRHPEDREPEPEPEPLARPLAAALAENPVAAPFDPLGQQPTQFIDPTVDDTLTTLYRLILAYNGERFDGSASMPRHLTLRKPDKHYAGRHRFDVVPTMAELQAWFARLSYRERVAIDFKFHDPRRYEEFLRAERAKANRGEGDRSYRFAGGGFVKLYAEPANVFRSPRDGKPFVIKAEYRGRDPRRPFALPRPALLIREAEGARRPNPTFLTEETERRAIDADGQLETLVSIDPEPH